MYYPAQVTENYDYEYSYDDPKERTDEEDFPRSAIEWFDARTRRRRDTQKSSDNKIMYEVCIRSGQHNTISLHHCCLKLSGYGAVMHVTLRLTVLVCLFNCSHSLERKLTGMAIADITLLSGFEPKTEDLDLVSYSIASEFP